MKYIKLPLITAGCLIAAGGLFAQPDDPVRLGFTYKTETAPAIDGTIDAVWDAIPSHGVDNWIPLDGPSPSGPEDHDGWWKSMYDDTHLYFLVSIDDDVLVPLHEGLIDNADSIEIFISFVYNRDTTSAWNVSAYDFNDYHMRFGIGPAVGGSPVIAAGMHSTPFWVNPTDPVASTQAPGVEYAVVETDTGYTMEIALELDEMTLDATFDFRDTAPAASADDVNDANFADYRKVGLEVQSTDHDGGGNREYKRGWSNFENMWPGTPAGNGSDQAWVHPKTFGTLVFVEGGGIVDPPVECPEAGYADDAILHWVYNYGDCWLLWDADFNGNWGLLHVGARNEDGTGWVYHFEKEWIYLHSGSVTSFALIYSADLGWLAASEGYGAGQYYRYDTDDFETWVP